MTYIYCNDFLFHYHDDLRSPIHGLSIVLQ